MCTQAVICESQDNLKANTRNRYTKIMRKESKDNITESHQTRKDRSKRMEKKYKIAIKNNKMAIAYTYQ